MAATLELLGEGGYGAVTMESVAQRAGVGKPTVYRRWPTRAKLVFELLNDEVAREPVPDTGSISGDLTAFLSGIGRQMATFDRSVVGDVVGALIADADFAEHVCRERLTPDRVGAMEVWHRAVDRGEVSAEIDGAAVIDELVGSCFWRIYVLHRRLDSEQVASIVERVLYGVIPVAGERTRAS